ncbi:hypothetical protein pb186bvf_005501 [Paramecium bursaria]
MQKKFQLQSVSNKIQQQMQQNQIQTKVTKKVIIVNQKSDVLQNNNQMLNQFNQTPKIVVDPQEYKDLDEMKQLHQKNESMLQDLQIQIKELHDRTEIIEQKLIQIEQTNRKKKKRRTAAEIEKNFKCQHCEKCYGSEVSNIQNIKNEHHILLISIIVFLKQIINYPPKYNPSIYTYFIFQQII